MYHFFKILVQTFLSRLINLFTSSTASRTATSLRTSPTRRPSSSPSSREAASTQASTTQLPRLLDLAVVEEEEVGERLTRIPGEEGVGRRAVRSSVSQLFSRPFFLFCFLDLAVTR